jgi:proline dehydrogenase
MLVSRWSVARKVASRFVAGDTLVEAIEVVKSLNEMEMIATLDHLGEDTDTDLKAVEATEAILEILDAIEDSGVISNVSIKLTQIGLMLDEDMAAQNVARILERARIYDNFVRIDMEDSPTIDKAITLYKQMRTKFGFDNVGMVVQSYLYRTEEDTLDLLKDLTRIRLVKGAYDEPAEISYAKKSNTDSCFDRLTGLLLQTACSEDAPFIGKDGKWPPIPAIATHDQKRIVYAKQIAQQFGLSKNKLEFQMLYGIKRGLQQQLVGEGYPVRIYVPFGKEWYPYFMRRLAERPANLWFFISNFLKD